MGRVFGTETVATYEDLNLAWRLSQTIKRRSVLIVNIITAVVQGKSVDLIFNRYKNSVHDTGSSSAILLIHLKAMY